MTGVDTTEVAPRAAFEISRNMLVRRFDCYLARSTASAWSKAQAVSRWGMKLTSVHWPVTVGDTNIVPLAL